jgi:DNA-binding transcriptional LysR family regulator
MAATSLKKIALMRSHVIHLCMTQREPGWELFRTFLEVARDGSLSGAARKLALTQPTVGRHIDALEAASAALRRTASSGAQTDRGTVRIAASEMVGCEVLPPMLARFRDSHPGIVLELALSNRNEDLLRRDADIAVRMARPRQKSLLARRIGKTVIGLYAHRDYLKAYGVPKTAADFAKHCLIGFDRDDWSLRSLGTLPQEVTRDHFGFRCDSDLAQFAALRAGVGIGGCQHNIARRFDELVPVLGKAIRFELEVWIAMHEDMKSTTPVRMLFDHLAAGLSAFVSGADIG